MDLIKKEIQSFGHAFRGIAMLFKEEGHARIHAIAVACIVGLGFWLGLDAWEWCAILMCMGLVISLEAVNTAVERLADRVSKEKHPLLKDAKDVAAGAVLIAVLFAAVIWSIIFIPKILDFFLSE
ncbi:MAG: diacylglycerol kinase family protein [Bacteroidia bacterium]